MQRNAASMTLLEVNTKQNKTNKQTKKELKTKTKNNQKNLIELLKCCYGKKQIHTAAPKKKKSFTPSGTNMHVLNIITLIAKIRSNIGSDYCNQHTTTGKHTQTTIQREQLCLESSPTNPQNTSQS